MLLVGTMSLVVFLGFWGAEAPETARERRERARGWPLGRLPMGRADAGPAAFIGARGERRTRAEGARGAEPPAKGDNGDERGGEVLRSWRAGRVAGAGGAAGARDSVTSSLSFSSTASCDSSSPLSEEEGDQREWTEGDSYSDEESNWSAEGRKRASVGIVVKCKWVTSG